MKVKDPFLQTQIAMKFIKHYSTNIDNTHLRLLDFTNIQNRYVSSLNTNKTLPNVSFRRNSNMPKTKFSIPIHPPITPYQNHASKPNDSIEKFTKDEIQAKFTSFLSQSSSKFIQVYLDKAMSPLSLNGKTILTLEDYCLMANASYDWNYFFDGLDNIFLPPSELSTHDTQDALFPGKTCDQILRYIALENLQNAPIECGISLYNFLNDRAAASFSDQTLSSNPCLRGGMSLNVTNLSLYLIWAGGTERWIHAYDISKDSKENPLISLINSSTKTGPTFYRPYKLDSSDRKTHKALEHLLNFKVRSLNKFMIETLHPALEKLGPHYDSLTCQRAIYAFSRCQGVKWVQKCVDFLQIKNLSGTCSGTDVGRIAGTAFTGLNDVKRGSDLGWDILRCGVQSTLLPYKCTSPLSKSICSDMPSLMQGKFRLFNEMKEPLTISLLHESSPPPTKSHLKEVDGSVWDGKADDSQTREGRGLNILRFMASPQFPNDVSCYPTIDFALLLKDYFENLTHVKWKGDFASITHAGRCQNCQSVLEPLAISHDAFVQMRERFFQDIVKGKDVFMRTTPKELDNFLRFLDTNKFDVVIDSLNVCLGQSPNIQTRMKILSNAIEYFTVHKKQRVAVFGRKHMITWPNKASAHVLKSCPTFLMDNVSKDDPFFLYAAMHAGLGTMILTKDMFRDHKYLLGDHGSTFDSWRKMHQLYLLKVRLDGTVNILPNLKHSISTQGRGDHSWHIPYQSGVPLKVYENLNTWLCLRRQ